MKRTKAKFFSRKARLIRRKAKLFSTSLAAIGETYFTAWGLLFESLYLQDSDTLLVRGSTSTVGMAAIQIASALVFYNNKGHLTFVNKNLMMFCHGNIIA